MSEYKHLVIHFHDKFVSEFFFLLRKKCQQNFKMKRIVFVEYFFFEFFQINELSKMCKMYQIFQYKIL